LEACSVKRDTVKREAVDVLVKDIINSLQDLVSNVNGTIDEIECFELEEE
jgi:hypothetical protein